MSAVIVALSLYWGRHWDILKQCVYINNTVGLFRLISWEIVPMQNFLLFLNSAVFCGFHKNQELGRPLINDGSQF